MRFQFLGTAAAEGIPALWCECETCRKAWQNGGKDVRRRTCYLLDDDTLVDFGPDIYAQVLQYKIDLTKIKRVILTHPHEDHLNAMDLLSYRRHGFSVVTHPIRFFASRQGLIRAIGACALQQDGYSFEEHNSLPVVLQYHKPVTDDDLTIYPFRADHAPGLEPMFFALERGGKRILIANDTGWPEEKDWEILLAMKFDLVTIDSTMGIKYADCCRGHMGANWVVKFAEKLREAGCLNPGAPVFANHFSHNGGNVLHTELENFYTAHDIQVAYDGLAVTL